MLLFTDVYRHADDRHPCAVLCGTGVGAHPPRRLSTLPRLGRLPAGVPDSGADGPRRVRQQSGGRQRVSHVRPAQVQPARCVLHGAGRVRRMQPQHGQAGRGGGGGGAAAGRESWLTQPSPCRVQARPAIQVQQEVIQRQEGGARARRQQGLQQLQQDVVQVTWLKVSAYRFSGRYQ